MGLGLALSRQDGARKGRRDMVEPGSPERIVIRLPLRTRRYSAPHRNDLSDPLFHDVEQRSRYSHAHVYATTRERDRKERMLHGVNFVRRVLAVPPLPGRSLIWSGATGLTKAKQPAHRPVGRSQIEKDMIESIMKRPSVVAASSSPPLS